jgi:hypothetical protein
MQISGEFNSAALPEAEQNENHPHQFYNIFTQRSMINLG